MPGHDEVLQDLRRAHNTGDLIIFAGKRVSCAGGLPEWRDVVEQLLTRLSDQNSPTEIIEEIRRLLEQGRIIDALSAAKDAIGAVEFCRKVETLLDDTDKPAPQIVKTIASLAPKLRAILTPNLDRFLERELASHKVYTQPIGDLGQRRKYILKLRGTLSEYRTWVLSRDQIDNAPLRSASVNDTFTSIYRSFPILFVGCDFSEEEALINFGAVHAHPDGQPPKHFAIITVPLGIYKRKTLEAAGIRLITCSPQEEIDILQQLTSEHIAHQSTTSESRTNKESFEQFITRYRNHMTLDRWVTLFDLMNFGQSRGLNFQELFVLPRAYPIKPLDEPATDPSTSIWDNDSEIQRVDNILANPAKPWVLMLGLPGSGKTALTRWLIQSLCRPDGQWDDRRQFLRDLVPVRIELRRFDAAYRRQTTKPYDFFKYIHEDLTERAFSIENELFKLAQTGRLLWIFDGLDEVIDPHSRRHYAQMIAGLMSKYATCRGLVTGRSVGVAGAEELLTAAGIATYELLPLNEEEIDDLLDRWYAAMFVGAEELGQRRREQLRQGLLTNSSLQSLCQNPLLATMVAYLSREGSRPKQRHQLYQTVIRRLVERWDGSKNLPFPGGRQFSVNDRLKFFRSLAWAMINHPIANANIITEHALLRVISRFCELNYKEDFDAAQQSAEQFIEHLRERDSVVVSLGGEFFGFVHRAFMEHLAASEMYARVRSDQWNLQLAGRVFQEHWTDDLWQETLPLFCGMLGEDRPALVVSMLQEALTDSDEWGERDVMTFLGFALRCLAEAGSLVREPIRTFSSHLTDLLQHIVETVAQRGQGVTADPALEGLRLCTGQWPEHDRMLQWADAMDGSRISPFFHATAYQCALCAGGTQRRLPVLLSAIRRQAGHLDLIVRDAALLGPWSDKEIDAIMSALEEDQQNQRWMLPLFVQQGSRHSSLIQAVAEIANSDRNQHNRSHAAQALLGVPTQRDFGVEVLFSLLRADDPWIRIQAAQALAYAGVSGPALPVLVMGATFHPITTRSCVEALCALAVHDVAARTSLDEVMSHLRSIEDAERLAVFGGCLIESALEEPLSALLLSRVDAEADEQRRFNIIEVLLRMPTARVRGLEMLSKRMDPLPCPELLKQIIHTLQYLSTSESVAWLILGKIIEETTDDGIRQAATVALLVQCPELLEGLQRQPVSDGDPTQEQQDSRSAQIHETLVQELATKAPDGASETTQPGSAQAEGDETRTSITAPSTGDDFEADASRKRRQLLRDLRRAGCY
jgi:hypothetical protein